MVVIKKKSSKNKSKPSAFNINTQLIQNTQEINNYIQLKIINLLFQVHYNILLLLLLYIIIYYYNI